MDRVARNDGAGYVKGKKDEKEGFKMKKLGYYLSIAYYDVTFRLFFIILVLKFILFTYIGRIGIDGFLPAFGAVLITLSFSLIIKNNFIKYLYLFFLNCSYSIILFSHSLYLKYFDDFASIYNLVHIYQLPSITDSIIKMVGKEFFFIIDILFLPLLFLLKPKNDFSSWERIKVSAILLLLGLYCNINPLISYIMTNDNIKSILDRHIYVGYAGIINYQIADIHNFLTIERGKTRVTKDEINLVEGWKRRHGRLKKENDLSGMGKGMNLIVIQVESLQNFVIEKKYNGIEITPNLNRLAREGIYFRNIYDQAADGNSSDATLLANTALYPARKGAASFLYAGNLIDSLPKVLKENGYTTAAMHAYYKSYWNSAMFEKALGFEHQYYKDNYTMTDIIGWGLSDKAFFSQSFKKLKGLPTPFYAFLRTLSTHGPFDYVTRDIDNFPLHELEGELIGNYLRSMHYVDSAIGEFLQKLSGYNLDSNTVIVIYGDHRARLSEPELRRIGISDMSEIRKVPLIINLPNRKEKDERDTIGGLIDVTPSICNILGIDVSDKFFIGKDLGGRDSFAVFRNGSYIFEGDFITKTLAQQQLVVSDLILERDIIRLIRNGQ